MNAADTETQMTIGQVAQRAGVRASTIRYYEERGVLRAPDRVAGQRRYGSDVLRRLAIIDVAQRAGFSLTEAADLLASADGQATAGGACASSLTASCRPSGPRSNTRKPCNGGWRRPARASAGRSRSAPCSTIALRRPPPDLDTAGARI